MGPRAGLSPQATVAILPLTQTQTLNLTLTLTLILTHPPILTPTPTLTSNPHQALPGSISACFDSYMGIYVSL